MQLPLTTKRAFSLVELSIVLVILGLLVGGVLAGQSLIRAAELRAVTTEYSRYSTAVQSFRDKYFALPGDMQNATAFWGAANTAGTGGQCADRSANAGTGTQTCNGDGNGDVGLNSSSPNVRGEFVRFWQHLANAGLIEGNYTGVFGTSANSVTGENIPASKLNRGGWNAFRNRNPGETAYDNSGITYGNVLMLGRQNVFEAVEAVMKPEEAWNIDTKMDDGKPRRGKVINGSLTSNGVNCLTPASLTDLNAEYALNVSTIFCAPMFIQQF